MKEYLIPVIYSCWGVIKVNADSLEEAITKAEDEGSLPYNAEYIDGSFEVDEIVYSDDFEDEYMSGYYINL